MWEDRLLNLVFMQTKHPINAPLNSDIKNKNPIFLLARMKSNELTSSDGYGEGQYFF